MSAAPRVVHRVVASLALLTSVVVLCGCVGEGPDVEPSPSVSASVSAVFASEEDALAAATTAYAAYAMVVDQILADGGANPDRVDAVAVGAARDSALNSFKTFVAQGYRSVGLRTFSGEIFQSMDKGADFGDEVVSIYICVDVSAVDVLDRAGTSVVGLDRPDRQAFEVGYTYPSPAGDLLVSRLDAWDGVGICPES